MGGYTNEEDKVTIITSEKEFQSIKSKMMNTTSASQMADWFKAFSDSTRIKIVDALLHEELCVNDLSILIDMGQSAVSHQLRLLRNLRIVKRRKEGKTVFYSLHDTHIEQIFQQTLQHLSHE
ncbi:ArsR/SmtB family transcription factor [Paenibacillus typhae]|uniref:Transcriptional regulator, ArsR family n=1 Tax=Paenibacillus typhae TaxID=1174501 RepID=A0A1G8FAD1_9BACL|nr:metalloregulator ArsR/SmtB family transcription factor [Paenibacillus typhae]SDH79080.1 transcriptional regulator, ArsR family [Paenibacillus typhae]